MLYNYYQTAHPRYPDRGYTGYAGKANRQIAAGGGGEAAGTVDDLEALRSQSFIIVNLYQGHYIEPETFSHYKLFRSTEPLLLRSPAEQRFCTTECVILNCRQSTKS